MESSKIRLPAVAGQFYPSSKEALKAEVESLIDKGATKTDALACILPHAGYIYSGAVAGWTASRINIKDTLVLLGPNHTGLGSAFSIMCSGAWQTPLGKINIDSALADSILNGSRYLRDDALAHLHEHSLEVELPFLQYFRPDFQIVPIAISCDDIGMLKELGEDIARAIKGSTSAGSAMLLASSDMTHYEPQEEAEKKDAKAIEAILSLDEDKLMERVRRLGISMCGYAPVIAMISAAKKLGATGSSLVKYQTSGDITGDKSSVVGYAGIIIK